MGLQGELKKVNVSVLNGQLKSFETTPVECTIESLDGKTSLKVTALTTRDGQLFNYRENRDYFIGNNRHCVIIID